MTTLKLHFAPQSCALVSLIALEETGHPFEVELVALSEGAQRTPEYLALNPKGKVPVLIVDGKPMTETVAILTFLAGTFPEKKLLPDPGDLQGRCEVLSDLAYCASTLHPFVSRIRLPQRFCAPNADRVRAQAVQQMRQQLDWIEARLASGWWYGETWSLMDAYLNWIWLAVSRPPGIEASAYPNLARHANQGTQRPAAQRALARRQAAIAEVKERAPAAAGDAAG